MSHSESEKPPVNKTKVEPTPKVETTPKANVPKTDVPHLKSAASFLKKNHGKIVLGAVGAGIIKSMIDGEDDDLLSSAGKGIETGIVATAASYGSQALFKNETVQDLVRGQIKEASKDMQAIQAEKKMAKIGAKMPAALGIGLIAIGAATVLDIGQRVGSHMDAEAYKKQQEFEMKQRVNKQKGKNKEKSYGYVQDGEIVFDLFNSRSGHHKMGNAKFN